MNRVKRIERYGVSVYDLRNLPEQIDRTNFEFTLTLRTSNVQFLTQLLAKIQEVHVKRIYAKRD